MTSIHETADKLYRHHFGKMVATLLYCSRDIDPDTAEDIVHDTFAEALTHWESDGVPANPAGWIYKVCRNKALNKIKRDSRLTAFDAAHDLSIDQKFSESAIDDYGLRLLFACAHPALAPKTQVVITLKYVVNLRVEAIARVLGMTIDGVDKLLVRARQKIKDEKILLEEPVAPLLHERVPVVHKVIYLIFNEGYKSAHGKEIVRKELCEDALLLNRSLLESQFGTKETAALQALMLFNAARFDARFDSSDELVELENQDRSKWNHQLILVGHDMLEKAHDEHVSTYHLEASIAYVHCMSPDFASTNWSTISKLYARLLRLSSNPFVELNYAIALYYTGEKSKSFELLLELQSHPYLNHYYLLNAALGKFCFLEGKPDTALIFLRKASAQTTFAKEKKLIEDRITKLSGLH